MELISVVVPIYNTVRYLMRCIESIQHQTYSELQIILVDDGSTDGCSELCDEICRNDSRIIVIHKENAGQGLARNDGIRVATGEYITFVDSDDWIGENHIFNLYEAITKNRADVALGDHTWVNVKGEHISKKLDLAEGVYEDERVKGEIILPLIGADVYDKTDVIINSSVSMNLYRMNVIKNNGIEFISERVAVAEDFYFNLDFLYCARRVIYCKNGEYFYCQNTGSTCEKYNPKRFERTLKFYELTAQRIKKYGLSGEVGYRAERSFLMKLRVAIRHIVMSDLSYREKVDKLKAILDNQTVKMVLYKYPIDTYGFSLRWLTKMMKRKDICGVYCLMYVREKGTNNALLKKVLVFLGLKR